ncbi:co-chaperone GroES [Candidatus Vesicomyidisocius calyptogenae]|uniref:Co-chaperonin GroES n=1 Tax=Vesicomyosocius okutanii subsp. Calyptogena okutanii (strain HA) TaxID=412965 RepID=CH10_VESOH|nr:co-chaperone GroES [Candidatus Vesicomyosocius okutanii]A5CWP5.1 RecName: Full=Co-chaperonin GroES; AltName: Full=10 kDa chaperonin; AltName: Full=Chaperonin-10; Short=Cpn10 [Candidatus Vesicomyosocius okutanii]BAF61634.1 chaperonin GroES [Candidatus Vesicomyosocius okutanii]
MNIRPLHDRVVVRRVEEKKTTSSGLIIPDSATEKPSEGVVVAVGNGKKNDNGDTIALDVTIGNKVLFAQYAGTEIKVDGKKLLIMKEGDIVAVIK